MDLVWGISDEPLCSRASSWLRRLGPACSPSRIRRSGQFFPTSVGHDYLKLPSIHKVGPGDWRPLSLSLSFAEVLEVRREIIRSAVLKFAPDVVLVDHMPHGAMGELVPTLEALRAAGPGSFWVFATSWTRRRLFASGGIWRARSRRWSSTSRTCWSTDPGTSSTWRTEYDLPEGVSRRLRYCGYVCSPTRLAVGRRHGAQALPAQWQW